MAENFAAEIRFCDEYEELLQQCLQALTQWTQLRGFDNRHGFTGMRAKSETQRAEGSYVATFSALRLHSRGCILCEERLRVHANSRLFAAAFRAS